MSSGLYTNEEVLEAFCRDVHTFADDFAVLLGPIGIVEEVITLSAVVLGVVVVFLLIINVAHKSEIMHEYSSPCQEKGCKNLMFIMFDFL